MDIKKKALIKEIKRRVQEVQEAAQRPKFDLNKYFFPKQFEFFRGTDKRFKVAVCSRRAGKCQREGTLVITERGVLPIEQVRSGDFVFGYNMDGSVSKTRVRALIDQGIKEVVDIRRGGTIIASCTLEHPWLVEHSNGELDVQSLSDITDLSRTSLKRAFTDSFGGTKHVKEAYALGALSGDGCSRGSGVIISSIDESVVIGAAASLGATKVTQNEHNYSWSICGLKKAEIPFYIEWLHNKYAHEKISVLEELYTWDRTSLLNYIAGLIDTDGSVRLSANRLYVDISMQALPILENCQMLMYGLFQATTSIIKDDRAKYKNGPVYSLRISSNVEAVRVLKQLSPFLKCERKQWRPEYESLFSQNQCADKFGLKNISEPYKAQCYDLSIENETKLYLLANGTVTHNTIGIIGDVLDACLSTPKFNCLYITLTRENCVEIIWPDLLSTIEEFGIPCKINHQRLSVTFANGSKFACAGAKDKREVGKFRGRKYHRIYIDEAQNFPSYIQDMIEADLIPTLRDYRGSMLITGTPGPLKRGFFYGISTNGQWESHTWTAFENPHMHNLAAGKDLEKTLEEERQVRNIDKNDPTYIRETYGVWAEDRDSLVFKFDKSKNVYTQNLPGDLNYVFGIDLGYNDADAIAVLGYSNSTGKVYLVEEVVERKQGITELVNQIEALKEKYKPIRMVMDAGGLGKKIQEEIRKRYAIPVEAADKNRKFEYIEMLNDDLRTGKLQTFQKSIFEDDCYLVQWDRDVEDPTKIKISKSYHSDICDAVLYGWRECNHYFKHEVPAPVALNSPKWLEELEAREMEEFEHKRAGHTNDWGVDDDDLKGAFEV